MRCRFRLRSDGLPAMESARCPSHRTVGRLGLRHADAGRRLVRLIVEHPQAEQVRATLGRLTLLRLVEVRAGTVAGLRADVEMGAG